MSDFGRFVYLGKEFMTKILIFFGFFLVPLFALKAEIHPPEKESSNKMFTVIYQGYIKPGREKEYQEAWNKVARYFIEQPIDSCALSLEIQTAIHIIKDCLDPDRKMEVIDDHSAESNFTLSPEQEKIMNLVYEEVENAIQEGNPPFAAIITDAENNILAVSHNKANTKQLAIAHAEIEAIQMACKILGKKKLEGCILYANAESCAMCSTAIIKSGISQVFYGAPHESGSNPDIYLREINQKTTPKLKIYGGYMKDKFFEQIKRGRGDILLKESKIGQFNDGVGAFANRDFKKGEVVIKWNLKALSEEEYERLSKYEKDNFCHRRNGIRWLYPDPERHVNRFSHPNVVPDFEKQANIALRDIEKGEELSIADNTVEDF